MNEIEQVVKDYILDTFMTRDDGSLGGELLATTPLITGGLLDDNMDTLSLVIFLEDRFGIHISDREMRDAAEGLDTVADIASFVARKKAQERITS